MIDSQITSPSNESEFEKYYYFRWKYLRKEFNQELGTERDDFDDCEEYQYLTIHRMIFKLEEYIKIL